VPSVASALLILPLDQQPPGQRQYRPLTEKDLADLAARRGQIYKFGVPRMHCQIAETQS